MGVLLGARLRLAPRRTPRTPRKLSLPLVHKMGEGQESIVLDGKHWRFRLGDTDGI
jgi:hypothetical protein